MGSERWGCGRERYGGRESVGERIFAIPQLLYSVPAKSIQRRVLVKAAFAR